MENPGSTHAGHDRGWPNTPDELRRVQRQLGGASPPLWPLPSRPPAVAGCFVCFERGQTGPGGAGQRAWAAAAVSVGGRILAGAVVRGAAGYRYEPGLLALREGPLLETAVRRLPEPPEVLLVNATGRDHPRRAGLATHLGAALGLPTVGVTHRPLLASGSWPPAALGARRPLRIDGEEVGAWLRTEAGARPLAVDAAWRTDVEVASALVLLAGRGVRTPEPLREARRLARSARAYDSG